MTSRNLAGLWKTSMVPFSDTKLEEDFIESKSTKYSYKRRDSYSLIGLWKRQIEVITDAL